ETSGVEAIGVAPRPGLAVRGPGAQDEERPGTELGPRGGDGLLDDARHADDARLETDGLLDRAHHRSRILSDTSRLVWEPQDGEQTAPHLTRRRVVSADEEVRDHGDELNVGEAVARFLRGEER